MCSGDLFADTLRDGRPWNLVHCVSADLAMGKGIAVTFKRLFGGVAAMAAAGPRIGDALSVPMPAPRAPQRAYALVTKQRYSHKPTLDSLRRALARLRDVLPQQGHVHVAFPRLGCGLDGLAWGDVRPIIEQCLCAPPGSPRRWTLRCYTL